MKYQLILAVLLSGSLEASKIISLDCSSEPEHYKKDYPLDFFLDVDNEKAYFISGSNKKESTLIIDEFFYRINYRFNSFKVVMDINRTNGNFHYTVSQSRSDDIKFGGSCKNKDYKPIL